MSLNTFTLQHFPERLAELLEQRGYSQNQLAIALGISRSTITGWIRHHKLPDAATLARLCDELACSADWLLGLGSNAEKTDPLGRVRWVEYVPPFVTGFQREQIEHGVRLFNTLFSAPTPPLEIRNRYSLQYLQFAIQAAIRSGAIQITHVARDEERENRLKEMFPMLKDVVVAAIPSHYEGTIIRAEFVAFLAATTVLNQVVRESIVGLGVGYTLLRMCEQSVPSVDQFKGTHWLPLVTYTDDLTSGYTANQLARLMELRHPGSQAVNLPHPDMCEKDSQLQADFEQARRYMGNVHTMFITVNGIGRRDRNVNNHPLTDFRTADYTYDSSYLRDRYAELSDKDAFGGELLSVMVDTQGNIIDYDAGRVWQVDLDVLRYNADMVGRVCIVAARDYKAPAVQTCLQARLANALVIDSEIADYLITHPVDPTVGA